MLRLKYILHPLKHLLTSTNGISRLVHNRSIRARKSCLLDQQIIDISRLLVLLEAFVCAYHITKSFRKENKYQKRVFKISPGNISTISSTIAALLRDHSLHPKSCLLARVYVLNETLVCGHSKESH